MEISLTSFCAVESQLFKLQLSKHFTYLNTPWSQCVHITDFLLYAQISIKSLVCYYSSGYVREKTAWKYALLAGNCGWENYWEVVYNAGGKITRKNTMPVGAICNN